MPRQSSVPKPPPEPVQRLFVFEAEHSNHALIIRKERHHRRETYQMIHWNMETNHFIEGQWILNKQLYLGGCSISPNGRWFGWIYNQYGGNYDTHAGVSAIPYFTAHWYSNKVYGRYHRVRFDRQSRVYTGLYTDSPDMNIEWQLRSMPSVVHDIPELSPSRGVFTRDLCESGLQAREYVSRFRDNRVSIRGYQLWVNDELVYDAELNRFREVVAPYSTIFLVQQMEERQRAQTSSPPPLPDEEEKEDEEAHVDPIALDQVIHAFKDTVLLRGGDFSL